MLFEVLNHRPLDRRQATEGAHLVSSLGIYLVVLQVIVLVWGNEAQVLRSSMAAGFRYGGLLLTRSQFMAGAISVALLFVFWTGLHFTKVGLQLRALAGNRVQLAVFGYDTDRLRLVSFGACGFLSAASSLLTAYDVGFNPNVGLQALLLAVVSVIIGGRQFFLGAVIGGLVMGLLRAHIVWYLSASWQEAVTCLLLAIFLLFRPAGLVSGRAQLGTNS
jgi:branched-chain amino acid transport system permease protein